jgi:hypothetical protein
MTYQPIPFSLIMPEMPAYMSDGKISQLWGQHPYIRSIQMEPFMKNNHRYNRVTIHFDDFKGYGDELREQITNGHYTTNAFDFSYIIGGAKASRLDFNQSRLLPCESSNPPHSEYSHIVAFQLQEVVRKQAEHIQSLESRLEEMEKKVGENVNIQSFHNETMEWFERRLITLDTYRSRMEYDIKDIVKQQNEQSEKTYQLSALFTRLKQDTTALIEWCSQPMWKRTSAFVSEFYTFTN